jgi:hypothetical protein
MSEHDPTDITAQEASRQDAKTRQRLAATTEVEDIRWLMGSKRGRRIVHRLLTSAGVFRISFHTNALQMAFNEGNRNQGNALLALITENCPERYADLLNEAKDK